MFNAAVGQCCCPTSTLPCTGGEIPVTMRVNGCFGLGLPGVTVYLDRVSPSAQSGVLMGTTDSSGCVTFNINTSGFVMGASYRGRAIAPNLKFQDGTTSNVLGLSCNAGTGYQLCPTSFLMDQFGQRTITLPPVDNYRCCGEFTGSGIIGCGEPVGNTMNFVSNVGSCFLNYNSGLNAWQGSFTASMVGASKYCCDCRRLDSVQNPTPLETQSCSVTIGVTFRCPNSLGFGCREPAAIPDTGHTLHCLDFCGIPICDDFIQGSGSECGSVACLVASGFPGYEGRGSADGSLSCNSFSVSFAGGIDCPPIPINGVITE